MTPSTFIPGTLVLGKYRICHPLAKGGMGLVYLGRTEGAEGFVKPVIIKQILSGVMKDEPLEEMFIREAQILAQLDHPNIVDVIDFGRHEFGYVMVLEYIRGFHFGQWLRYAAHTERQLPVWAVVHVMQQVLAACHHAHTLRGQDDSNAQVIHRDISPSNILIHERGHTKLVDFGVATSQLDQTDHRRVKGKASYMAPEIARGADPSPQTDCYATAVVLYQALAGRNPFRAASFEQTVVRSLRHAPPRLDTINAKVPSALATVIERALHKDPKRRHADAASFSAALQTAMGRALVDAKRRFALRIGLDFAPEALPASLGITPLTKLDEGWRRLPESALANANTTALPPEPDWSVSLSGDFTSTKTPVTGRSANPWVLGLVLLMSCAALLSSLAVWIWGDSSMPNEPVMVWAQGDVSATRANLRADEARSELGTGERVDPRVAPGEGPTTDETTAHEAADGPGTPSPLAAPVIAQSDAIRDCLADRLAAYDDSLDLSLRFAVNRQGTVMRATLTPHTLATVPPGRCILEIARSISFPPQPRSVAFRIPINASGNRHALPGGR